MRLNKRSLISMSLLVLVLLTATVVPALAKPHSDQFYGPTNVWISCANGGAGEVVSFQGWTSGSVKQIVDKKTGIVFNRTFFNRRMLPGIGADTGTMYYGSGPYESKVFMSEGPWGPIGTNAMTNDSFTMENDELIATVTQQYVMDQNGVVQMDYYDATCVLK